MNDQHSEKEQAPLAKPKVCGLAVWSLVLGIIGLSVPPLLYIAAIYTHSPNLLSASGIAVLPGILIAIAAVVCGHKASRRIKHSAASLSGRGLAIAGLVMGYILILQAVAGAVAGIVLPSFLHSKPISNERATRGTLQTMVACQWQFQAAAVVDQDRDGTGEFGYLQELGGNMQSNVPRFVEGQTQSNVVAGGYITKVLGVVDANGIATKSGYLYYMYLPNAEGKTTGEKPGLWPGALGDADPQEKRWICYAWPEVFGQTGKRCLVVNQKGEVFAAENVDAGGNPLYSGTGRIPAASAALDSTAPAAKQDDISAPIADGTAGVKGVDGQIWVPMGK